MPPRGDRPTMAGLSPGSTTATASILYSGFTILLAEGGGEFGGGTAGKEPAPPPPPHWGAAWSCGRRAELEDAFAVDLSLPPLAASAPAARVSLFGVFDGHAGSEVATYAAKNIAKAVTSSEAWSRGDPQAALTQAFVSLDAQLEEPRVREELSRLRLGPGGELPSAASAADAAKAAQTAAASSEARAVAHAKAEGLDPAGQRAAAEAAAEASGRARQGGGARGSRRGGAYGCYDARSGRYLGPEAGSTALVAIVITPPPSSSSSSLSPSPSSSPSLSSPGLRTVIAGSVGDSRALLGVPGARGRAVRCVSLSRDHTAQLPLERARVDAAGLSATPDGRVATSSSSIAMTRALGDARYKAAAPLRGGPAASDVVIGGDEAARRFAVRAGKRALAAGAGAEEAGLAAAEGWLDAEKAADRKADQAVPRQLRALVPHPDIAVALVGGGEEQEEQGAQAAAEEPATATPHHHAAATAAANNDKPGPPTVASPFLLLACYGVFEAMPNDAAVALIERRLTGGCSSAQAAAALVGACLAGVGGDDGATCERCGGQTAPRSSLDNITAVVVDLGGGGGGGGDVEEEEGDVGGEQYRQGA